VPVGTAVPGTEALPAVCFGVTSGFWDRVLGSVRSRTDTDRVRP
jgi:hypothetical protein